MQISVETFVNMSIGCRDFVVIDSDIRDAVIADPEHQKYCFIEMGEHSGMLWNGQPLAMLEKSNGKQLYRMWHLQTWILMGNQHRARVAETLRRNQEKQDRIDKVKGWFKRSFPTMNPDMIHNIVKDMSQDVLQKCIVENKL